jgi:hypothetical protein
MRIKTKQYAIWAALALCAISLAEANSIVTFQVDMTDAIATAAFDPATQTVAARGTFNNWGAVALTNNPVGSNPNLWTGTYNVTSNVYNTTTVSANGTVMSYKYSIEPGTTYEVVYLAGTHNRLLDLPSTSGASITTPQVFFSDIAPTPITILVTFQVDLAQQINTGAFDPLTSTAQARGLFNGWGGTAIAQTNDPSILRTNQNGLVTSNVYVGTYEIVGSPGQTVDYKYYIDTGANWDSPAPSSGDPVDNNNRFFNLGAGSTQAVPIVFFNDSPYAPVATNDITFQVDMSAQILSGNFDPASGIVELRGDFNGWGTPQILCTNDPAALNTNIYKTVVELKDGVGAFHSYKFWSSVSANGGWEIVAGNAALNRSVAIIGGPPNPTPHILAPVYFSDIDPSSLLPVDTTVTFSVSMTNAVGTDSHVFDPSVDSVYLNGVPSFGAWDTSLPQLTNYPAGSKVYSIDMLLAKGSPVQQTYKYGINGNDDEAPQNANHVRDVRTTGTYVMPLDTFGNMVVEPSFGNLQASYSTTPGHVLISWLGRSGVFLQTKTSLSAGLWMDHPETDGMSSTNWPSGGGPLFFRLVQP